jgi:hypothetical protein
MLDLILKLVDRCIQLLKERKQAKRELVDNYLSPILKDFDEVHDKYLETFRGYRELVSDPQRFPTTKHEVFDCINRDIVFTSGDRTRIWDLVNMEMPPELSGFIIAVHSYLFDGETILRDQMEEDIPGGLPLHTNLYRVITTNTLWSIYLRPTSDNEKRSQAIAAIDEMVNLMQARFARVHHEANKLRLALLK